MCEYAASRRELLTTDDVATALRALAKRTRPTLGFYGLVLLLAVLAPRVAAFGFLVIALISVLRPSRDRGADPRGA
jgi:hypothetical protein